MRNTLSLLAPFAMLAACNSPQFHSGDPLREQVVNVYSHRHYESDQQIFDAFTKKTGIHVNLVMADDDEILTRMQQEGANSPCDLLMTADAGRLGLAKVRDLLQPIRDSLLEAVIPAHLRDPDGNWFGLTMRARVFAYDKRTVDPSHLRTYADLTKPEWKGQVLVRTSEHVYNQSLLAAMIAHEGPDSALVWASGIVANLAREPKGSDTDQLLAIGEGIGSVAIVNSYYIGKLMKNTDPARDQARAVIGVAFPDLDGHGTHVNISGAGVARYAKHKAEAIALLEYLVSDSAQALFAEGNEEYPVRADVPIARELAAFGTLTPDTLNLQALATYNAEAVKLFDASGWH
ncbi:MAG: Fe(3+) ABC transporter substrate-binding protein [Flavobacteriales bacterium]|nr:Fe(3+) ABC transporter substrate-binding protein [Flavobacteriales bacterium]MCB9193826.1 Fe(3+) ABC transporter substrate-binding protein [Flavobacteriales bacterium]